MTPLNIENLTLIRAELFDFADSIALASPDTAKDARLAARAADKLASLRFRIAEIAEMSLTQDSGATYRDLNAALAEAEF